MPFQMRGREAWKSNAEVMQSAFPGIQAQIDDIFAAEDRVAARFTFRGNHRGEFLGIAPTGRDVVFTSLELYRVVDGQLAEEWISSDLTTLMRQLTEPDAS
jgi:predicted ester cyclase